MIPTDASQGARDERLRTTLVAVALSGATLALGTLATIGPKAARSVAVGAVLAVGNLWALARVVTALLQNERRRRRGPGGWALLAVAKMLGLFTVVWLLMRYAIAAPIPMLVGFGALPIGIAIGSVVSDRKSVSQP
jgi:hypothetical protein